MSAAVRPEGTAPQRDLNRLEVLRGLRVSVWEAGYSTAWTTLTTGAFLTGFALWLGANSLVIGLITAIPTFAALVQIVSSYLGERLPQRRPLVAWFAVAGRTVWLPILLLPWLLPRSAALDVFLVLFTISYVLLNVPTPAFMSWMSDLVPPDFRGRYFGRRNKIAGVASMAIGLPAAFFLDAEVRQNHHSAVGFGVLFGAAVVGGLLSFVCLLRQPEPPYRPSVRRRGAGIRGVLDYYRAPLADRNFVRLLKFSALFVIGQNLAAPFFNVYALERLHLSYVWLQVYAAMTSLASLAFMPLWGYLSDKFGSKPLLIIGVLGVFSLPLSWALTMPGHPALNMALLTEINLPGAAFWAAVNLTQFNLLIASSPPDKTPIYVATMSAVTGLAGGIAPIAGGVMMRLLAGWHGSFLGMEVLNYHVTFAVSSALRIIALLFLVPLVDPGSVSTREVIVQLGTSTPRTWRSIRSLQRPVSVGARVRAAEALAGDRSLLGGGELIAALSDPSLAVRQEAARALGEARNPSAAAALIAAVEEPASGIGAEAAEALGKIGAREAVPALAWVVLQSGADLPAAARLAAIRALGEIGGHDAVCVLLDFFRAALRGSSGGPASLEACALALGRAGGAPAVEALAGALSAGVLPTGSQSVIIRALAEMGDENAAQALLAALRRPASSALAPLLADAMAACGATEAIEPLLDILCSDSLPTVGRRQLVVALGALLGQRSTVYNLLTLDEMARDAAVARILAEVRRRCRRQAARRASTDALESYVAGDYTAAVRSLNAAVRRRPAGPASDPTTARAKGASALAYLARCTGPLPAEAALLALVAARDSFEPVRLPLIGAPAAPPDS